MNWLVNSGYEDSRFLAVGPAFEEYKQQELSLGNKVERYILDMRQGLSASQVEHEDQGASRDDGFTDYLHDALMKSGDVICELKQQLGLAPIVNEGGSLNQKERDSLPAFVAVLLGKWSADVDEDPALVGKIVLAMKNKPRSITEGTIRKFLHQARAPYLKGEKKLNFAQKD